MMNERASLVHRQLYKENVLTLKSRSSISLSFAAVFTGLACPNIELEVLPPSPPPPPPPPPPLSLRPDVFSGGLEQG